MHMFKGRKGRSRSEVCNLTASACRSIKCIYKIPKKLAMRSDLGEQEGMNVKGKGEKKTFTLILCDFRFLNQVNEPAILIIQI